MYTQLLIVIVALYAIWLRVDHIEYTDDMFEVNKRRYDAPEAKLVDLKVCKTAYYDHGESDGELVVVIHGFSTPYRWAYRPVAMDLAKRGYRVVGYDYCGRGLSGPATVPHNPALYVSQVMLLLARLNLHRSFHLIGSSMGGAVSVLIADTFPNRVKTLQLLAPAGYRVDTPMAAHLVAVPIVGDLLYMALGRTLMIQSYARDCSPDRTAICDEVIRGVHLQFDYTPGFARSLLHTIREFPMNALQDVYRRVGRHHRPVQLLWGEEDTLIPFEAASELLVIMPKAKLKSFPKFTHGICVEAHDLVGPEMRRFIDKWSSKNTTP